MRDVAHQTHCGHPQIASTERNKGESNELMRENQDMTGKWQHRLCGQGDGGKFEIAESLCLLGSLLADGGAKLQ
jgi:hypothetical protein